MIRFFTIAIASVVLFLPLNEWLGHFMDRALSAALAFALSLVVIPSLLLFFWKTQVKVSGNSLPTFEDAFAKGDLRTSEYEISRAAQIAEFEDEGKHFYLAVGEDRTLFLSGQYLYDAVASKAFPCSKIKLTWHQTFPCTYLIECLGEPILEETPRPAFSEEEFEIEFVPDDRQLIMKSLTLVLADIDTYRNKPAE